MIIKSLNIISKWATTLYFLPLGVVIILFFLIYKEDKIIIPNLNKSLQIVPYSDSSIADGISEIKKFSLSENEIQLIYRLRDNKNSTLPFVGIAFNDTIQEKCVNPLNYTHINLSISSKIRQVGYLMLSFYVDGVSSDGEPQTNIIMAKEFSIFPGKNDFLLKIDEFEFADWNLSFNNITKANLKKGKLKKFRSMYIDINTQNRELVNNSISISRLTFEKSYKDEVLLITIFLLLYYGFVIAIKVTVLQHNKLISQREMIKLPYQIIELIDTQLEDLKQVINCVNDSYYDEDLNLKIVSLKCNLSGKYISKLLGDNFNNVTFKQYLNTIRISNAKYLLEKTDLKISQICFDVGYSNPTHFNRSFKAITGQSPSNYRKSLEEQSNSNTNAQ